MKAGAYLFHLLKHKYIVPHTWHLNFKHEVVAT